MIFNQNVSGGSSGGETAIYGINAKGWCGDLQTVGGEITIRTDQAVGTLTGLNTITRLDCWNEKFKGSTGLVGAVDLSSLRSGGLSSTFEGTRITSLNLKDFTGNSCLCKMCKDNSALTSVNLSLLRHLQVDPNIEYEQFNSPNIQYGFQNCTGLRELRLPSIRLDSWFWYYEYDEETGDESIDYLYGISGSFKGFIKSCTNLVLHFSSSLGNDLASLPNGEDYFFDVLCDYDSTTKTNCSIVYDLPPNDPISVRITGGYNGQVDRYPGGDTNSSLAWYYYNSSSTSYSVLYTSELLEPEVNDTIYSDPECTTSIGTIAEVYPVYDE